jgi:NTE family protein
LKEYPDSKKSHHKTNREIENILVLQGGGSLGAFGCGVFKTLVKHGLKFDIVTGTSIGAINGAIITGSKSDHPESDLENFWLELAESSYKIIPEGSFYEYDYEQKRLNQKKISSGPLNAWTYGVPKMFLPRWHWNYMFTDPGFLMPGMWTYLFDNSLLLSTLKNYIDYKKLGPKRDDSVPRFVITAVDVLTAEHLEYDSQEQQIEEKHLLASSGYPLNGFPWVKNGERYVWDGALISNTPLRQAFKASPRNDKNLYIIENYPKKRKELPSNMMEVFDRASDILFSDKTSYDIAVVNKMTNLIELIENMYDFIEKNKNQFNKSSNGDYEKIKKNYEEIVEKAGSEILNICYISRDVMENPHPLKNADFSPETVKNLILQGEQKAEEALSQLKHH